MNPRNDPTDLAHRLIVRAARRAPAPLSPRLEEEWLADLDSRTGALSRLRLALGCCWATGIITHDFRVPQLAASGAAAAAKPALAELRFDLPLLSRRTVAFLAIAAVHVLIIYAFVSGLAQHVVTSIPSIMHASLESQSQPQHPLPPPLSSTFKLKPVTEGLVDPVDPKLDFETQNTEVVLTRSVGSEAGAHPAPPRAVQRVAGGPGKGFPNTDDYYPTASRRIEETGAALVRVCVDTQGRLTAEPTLAASSGSRRIDEGALNLAKAGSGHYRPSLEDGAPVNSCFPYRIRFTLAN
jgi:protein TonB